MKAQKVNGFTTGEGITAICGLIIALVVGGYGLRIHPILLTVYILGILSFSIIYYTKLCIHCVKNCPCNPNLNFWRRIFKSVE